MADQLRQIAEEFDGQYEGFKRLLQNTEADDGSRFDLSLQIPNEDVDIKISDFLTRIEITNNIIKEIVDSEGKTLIPFALARELKNTISQCKQSIEYLFQHYQNAVNSGGITQIEGENANVHAPPGLQFSLITLIQQSLLGSSDSMLRSALEVRQLISAEELSDIKSTLDSWPSVLGEVAGSIKDARKKEKEINSAHETIAQYQQEIESIRKQAQEDNQTKQQETNEINARIEQIREITRDADTLKNSVDAFQSEFESFDRIMDSRNQNYDLARTNLDEAITHVHDSQEMIDERIERSEQMLTGATVAGLASTFGEIHEKLGVKLKWASVGFYSSIVILFITCLPILDYFFPVISKGLIGVEFSKSAQETRDSLAGFLIRATLILPASWLTLFNARKHANLFKLKEHYAYKYSIATSVDGFKRQAPGYEDVIAFFAFRELSFNPADKIDGKKMAAEHPFQELTNQVVDNVKSRLPKSGKNRDNEETDR
ncbi:MAG: hypothetical protein V6Z81_07465 [Parvularculales bacterium]